MKNIDFKKLLVLIVIIVVAVLVILATTKIFRGFGKPSEKVQEAIENQISEYFALSSIGHSSIYNGIDLIYDEDSVEVKDLSKGSLIEVALKYADDNDIEIFTEDKAVEELKTVMHVDAVGYKGEELRKIVKDLYDIDLPKESIMGESNYLYDYFYSEANDVYIKVIDADTYNLANDSSSMDFHVIETKKKSGKFISTVAVAYVYANGTSYAYAKDKNGSTVVVQNLESKDFPEDKVDEFTKYKFTTKKVDGKYVLVSIEQVK